MEIIYTNKTEFFLKVVSILPNKPGLMIKETGFSLSSLLFTFLHFHVCVCTYDFLALIKANHLSNSATHNHASLSKIYTVGLL